MKLVCALAVFAATLALSPSAHAQTFGPGSRNSKVHFTPIKARFSGSQANYNGSFNLRRAAKMSPVHTATHRTNHIAVHQTNFVRPVTFRGVVTTNDLNRTKSHFSRSHQAFSRTKAPKFTRSTTRGSKGQ